MDPRRGKLPAGLKVARGRARPGEGQEARWDNSQARVGRGRGVGRGDGGGGAYAGGGSRGNGHSGDVGSGRGVLGKQIKPVSSRLLEEKLQELEPTELLWWLTADRGVKALLETREPQEAARRALLAAVVKASSAGRSENLNQLLIWLRESALFQSLSIYLNSANTSKHGNLAFQVFLKDLVDLLTLMMTMVPSDSAGTVSLFALVIESRLVPAFNLQQLKPQLGKLKEMVEESMRRKDENDNPLTRAKDADEVQPPDDFRQISIFPTISDLNNFKPFLRKNLVNGNYKDLDTYLDVQFRLLREDFVRPLRDGIRTFKEVQALAQGPKKAFSTDIKIYHHARILFPQLTPQVAMQFLINVQFCDVNHLLSRE